MQGHPRSRIYQIAARWGVWAVACLLRCAPVTGEYTARLRIAY